MSKIKSFSHIIGLDLTNLGNKYIKNISESLHSAQVSFAAPPAPECVRGGVFITDSAPGESIRRKSGGFGPGALTDYNLSEFVARPPICCGKSLPKAGFEPEAGKTYATDSKGNNTSYSIPITGGHLVLKVTVRIRLVDYGDS